MKKIILLLTLSFVINLAFGQDCNPNQSHFNLQFNKLNKDDRFNAIGIPYLEESTGQYNIEDMPSLFFANQLWIGGTTELGQLRFSGATYPSLTNNYDFYPGPLNNDGSTFSDQCLFWDRTFLITKEDLKISIDLLYNPDGSINSNVCDQLPSAVLNWPARGNENLQPYMPTSEMAEFYDHNQDGIYNPCEGDLPALVGENCGINIGEIHASFPKLLTFRVRNDAGGPHLLTGGDPLGIEIHDYYFAFEGTEALETALFARHKIINKSANNYKDLHLGLWVDADIGCAFDDYSGCYSQRNMTYFYNEDPEDGDNGPNCSVGINSFGDEIPYVGIAYLKGFLDDQNNDLGMTAAISTFNCSTNPPDPALCDPENEDVQFFNILKGLNRFGDSITIDNIATNYMFDGNPADLSTISMCDSSFISIDTRSIMSTGGVTLQSGQSRDVMFAFYNSFEANLPCPDVNILLEVQDEMEALYNNCWKQTEVPDAPTIAYVRQSNDIEVTLSNSLTSNNVNDSYEALILGAPNQSDTYKYKFEGYKVYQVKDRNTAISALDNPEYSWLVYQTDIDNSIEDISNWETSYDVNNVKSWIQQQKVNASNQGIEQTFTLDYDYLNNKPIERNQEYYLVAIAYGHNEYESFNPITEFGQKAPYIQSNNLKVITIGKALDNEKLAPIITRISGQGNMNDLEIEAQSYADILNQTNNGRITYEVNKGPFDVTVYDEALLSSPNQFEIKVTGPWNDASSVCAYDVNDTYIQLTDIISGKIYLSTEPVGTTKDHVFDELGLIISLHDIDLPGDQLTAANGGINQKIKYKEGNGLRWLGSIHDGRALPSDLNLDLQRKDQNHDMEQRYLDYGANLFFPMKLNNSSTSTGNIISTTASSSFRLAQTVSKLNLTNVDIVLTPDKSLWSRCIVVETSSKLYQDILPGSTYYDFTQVKRDNPSVDVNGQPDGTGNGMGWFPGYAINVETGQRLNIFFGENTSLGHSSVPIADPSITDDMIWNPSNEQYNDIDPSLEPLLKGIYGGHHFIYVSMLAYDECAQLGEALSKSTISFRTLESITWTMAPLLNSGMELLPINQGLIPNKATISLRVNNKFAKEDINQDLERLKRCVVYDDPPVYEFEIVKNPGFSGTNNPDITNVPWAFSSNINIFRIFNLEEDVIVTLRDLSSNILNQWTIANQGELVIDESGLPAGSGIYIVNVKAISSGLTRSYKVVVMN